MYRSAEGGVWLGGGIAPSRRDGTASRRLGRLVAVSTRKRGTGEAGNETAMRFQNLQIHDPSNRFAVNTSPPSRSEIPPEAEAGLGVPRLVRSRERGRIRRFKGGGCCYPHSSSTNRSDSSASGGVARDGGAVMPIALSSPRPSRNEITAVGGGAWRGDRDRADGSWTARGGQEDAPPIARD